MSNNKLKIGLRQAYYVWGGLKIIPGMVKKDIIPNNRHTKRIYQMVDGEIYTIHIGSGGLYRYTTPKKRRKLTYESYMRIIASSRGRYIAVVGPHSSAIKSRFGENIVAELIVPDWIKCIMWVMAISSLTTLYLWFVVVNMLRCDMESAQESCREWKKMRCAGRESFGTYYIFRVP
tara:strand:+ start:318 stop:845 length:528 start_codon:yes stop_codon:yes gene_type:complete